MNLTNLRKLFGNRCVYCQRTVIAPSLLPNQNFSPSHATKDHDVPKCRIGYTRLENNEVLACQACNNAKQDMTGPEFMSFRATHRFAPSYIEWLEQRALKALGRK